MLPAYMRDKIVLNCVNNIDIDLQGKQKLQLRGTRQNSTTDNEVRNHTEVEQTILFRFVLEMTSPLL